MSEFMILKNLIETHGDYIPQLMENGVDITTGSLIEAIEIFDCCRKRDNGRYVMVNIIDDSENYPFEDAA